MNRDTLASMIDHTILKPSASRSQILQLCKEAMEHRFASVCVNPCHAGLVSQELKGSNVKTCVVVGFPLGANTTEIKALEAKRAVEQGAQEIDMVINIGALKDGNLGYVEEDIFEVVKAAEGAHVKVILETCLLSEEEKIQACQRSQRAGAHFVKTSTGFSTGGAIIGDISLMRKVVGKDLGVKASGGVKTLEEALSMIEAGANRIGTSSGIAIMEEFINSL